MWECDSCEKRFGNPKLAYTDADGLTVTSDSDDFEEIVFATQSGWYYCPHCGSEMINDLDDICAE